MKLSHVIIVLIVATASATPPGLREGPDPPAYLKDYIDSQSHDDLPLYLGQRFGTTAQLLLAIDAMRQVGGPAAELTRELDAVLARHKLNPKNFPTSQAVPSAQGHEMARVVCLVEAIGQNCYDGTDRKGPDAVDRDLAFEILGTLARRCPDFCARYIAAYHLVLLGTADVSDERSFDQTWPRPSALLAASQAAAGLEEAFDDIFAHPDKPRPDAAMMLGMMTKMMGPGPYTECRLLAEGYKDPDSAEKSLDRLTERIANAQKAAAGSPWMAYSLGELRRVLPEVRRMSQLGDVRVRPASEKVIGSFIDAANREDRAAMAKLLVPGLVEKMKDAKSLRDVIGGGSDVRLRFLVAGIENGTMRATAVMVVTGADGKRRLESREFRLSKVDGEWRVERVTTY